MRARDAPATETGRRQVLAMGGGALASCVLPSAAIFAAAPMPSDRRFRVVRAGSEIGTHVITFRPAENGWSAHTSINFQVRVAFVTAFRFVHESEEFWRDGLLTSLQSRTDNNGQKYEASGAPVGDGFRIVGPGGPLVAPRDLLTSNCLWNPKITAQSLLINAQEGGEIGVSIRRVGEESVSGAPGEPSTKFRMVTPQCGGYLWYDRNGHWVRAVLEIKGETLTYELV